MTSPQQHGLSVPHFLPRPSAFQRSGSAGLMKHSWADETELSANSGCSKRHHRLLFVPMSHSRMMEVFQGISELIPKVTTLCCYKCSTLILYPQQCTAVKVHIYSSPTISRSQCCTSASLKGQQEGYRTCRGACSWSLPQATALCDTWDRPG